MEKVQEFLFDNKDKMPEGVYLELQNEFKTYEANLHRKTYFLTCYHPSTETKFTATYIMDEGDLPYIQDEIELNGYTQGCAGDGDPDWAHVNALFNSWNAYDKDFTVSSIREVTAAVTIKK